MNIVGHAAYTSISGVLHELPPPPPVPAIVLAERGLNKRGLMKDIDITGVTFFKLATFDNVGRDD